MVWKLDCVVMKNESGVGESSRSSWIILCRPVLIFDSGSQPNWMG